MQNLFLYLTINYTINKSVSVFAMINNIVWQEGRRWASEVLQVDVMAGRMARGGGELEGLAPFPSGPFCQRENSDENESNDGLHKKWTSNKNEPIFRRQRLPAKKSMCPFRFTSSLSFLPVSFRGGRGEEKGALKSFLCLEREARPVSIYRRNQIK